MTEGQWKAFCEYRDEYKILCQKWGAYGNVLVPLIKQAAQKDTPEYAVENPVVYSTDYDKITEADEIKMIVIGDNPGKEEQLNKNRRYLCGQSGRLAEGFFNRTPELHADFRKNVIISNKTPVHTAKTLHLKFLAKNGGQEVDSLIKESQVKMAEITSRLHQKLVENSADFVPELWLVGYSELKPKKLFELYRDTLAASYEGSPAWDYVMVYQHFSMNCFNKDVKKCMAEKNLTVKDALAYLGKQHRIEIFNK